MDTVDATDKFPRARRRSPWKAHAPFFNALTDSHSWPESSQAGLRQAVNAIREGAPATTVGILPSTTGIVGIGRAPMQFVTVVPVQNPLEIQS